MGCSFLLGPFIKDCSLLGGSWDLGSTVVSTLTGAISNYKYSYFIHRPIVTKSHE